jgi:hypothetical protein
MQIGQTKTPTSRLYDALYNFLSQCRNTWKGLRHGETLCWMMVGMLQSQTVHLNGFGRMFVGGRFPRNCFCLVWMGAVYRGHTVPMAWRLVAQSSSTVRL